MPPCHSTCISLDPASNSLSSSSFFLACQRLGEDDWDSLAPLDVQLSRSLDVPKHTLHSDELSVLLTRFLPASTVQAQATHSTAQLFSPFSS